MRTWARLAVAAVGIITLAGCGGNTSSSSPSIAPTTATPTQTPTSPPTPLNTGPIHTKFIAHSFTGNGTYYITLGKVSRNCTGSGCNTAGGKYFVGAKFTITGINGTSEDNANHATEMIGTNDQIYPALDTADVAGNFNGGWFNVQAGETVKGWVAFRLPSGVKPAAVKWEIAAGVVDKFATWKPLRP